jgi:hypothetical protein
LGVLNFFREINEDGDRIIIRSYGGWSILGLVIFFTGLIVGAICLGVGFMVTGSDRSDLMMVGIATLAASPLGLLLRLIGAKKVVDYARREITDGGMSHSFSDIAFVAITEWVKIIRTENGNNRVPMFNVVLGLGSVDQAVLDEIVEDIRSTDVGDDFIAGDSQADEQAVDTFFVMTDLDRFTLLRSSGYPTLFRTSHRLSKTAGVPLLNLTGSSFEVASGDALNQSFGEMVAGNSVDQPWADTDDVSAGEVVVDTTPDGHEISWKYGLWLAMLLTALLGFGTGALALIMGMETFGWILAGVFWAITSFIVGWLLSLSGTHRIVIDGASIRYRPPFGAEKSIALDELLDVYVRPNVSGGMSVIMLLSDEDVVVVRGALSELKAVDRAIRRFFSG